jgi:ketosteroid isomerase-like protein
MIMTNLSSQKIDEFIHEFEDLFYAGDYATMSSYYASDAKLLAENMELVQGHPALEHFWRKACEGAKKMGIKRTIHVQNFESSGDLSYLTGIVTIEIPNGDTASLPTQTRYVTVWKRDHDGVWRIVIDISNRQPTYSS